MWRVFCVCLLILGLMWGVLGERMDTAREGASSLRFMLGERFDSTFVTHFALYLPDGQYLTRIDGADYSGDFPFFDLYWTPNPHYLYKHSYDDNTLWVIRQDGQPVRQLFTYINENNFVVAFSPKGERAAFIPAIYPDALFNEIWVTDIDGSNRVSISVPPGMARFQAPILWSPDDAWLYVRVCDAAGVTGCLFQRVRPDGTGWQNVIYPYAPLDYQSHFRSAWSPDGRKLAFQIEDTLYLALTEEAGQRLTEGVGQVLIEQRLSWLWSPDSQWLVYQDISSAIMSFPAQAEGEAWMLVSESEGGLLMPFMVEDWVYFLSWGDNSNTQPDLYRIPVTGGEAQHVLSDIATQVNAWDEQILRVGDWLVATRLVYDPTQNIPELQFVRVRPDGSDLTVLHQQNPDTTPMLLPGADETFFAFIEPGYGGVATFINLSGGLRSMPTPPQGNALQSPPYRDYYTANFSPPVDLPYTRRPGLAGLLALVGLLGLVWQKR